MTLSSDPGTAGESAIHPMPRLGAPATPWALEAHGVSKRFRRGGVWALRDVGLAIPPGTITALVGPNGAGKSTLMRSWVGFEQPTSGSVRVMGVDPATQRSKALGWLGYVSQSTGLYAGLSVGDHLELARGLRPGFDRAFARDRLASVGIPLGQRAGTLSGGQGAQVALTIALGTHAPVLLMDEPLASLDPLARNDLLSMLVTEVRARGSTALLSSHIVSDVGLACDSLVVLGAGRVLLHAPVAVALAEHRVTADPPPTTDPVIGRFVRASGEPVALVRSSEALLPLPSLEDVVLGYLAAGRVRTADR